MRLTIWVWVYRASVEKRGEDLSIQGMRDPLTVSAISLKSRHRVRTYQGFCRLVHEQDLSPH
jgi:hypothetical protein